MNARTFLFALAAFAHLAHAETDEEIRSLSAEANAETDPKTQSELFEKRSEVVSRSARERIAQFRAETDPEKKNELRESVLRLGVESEQPEIVTEIATDGKFAEKEIKIPELANDIPLRVVRDLGDPARNEYGSDVNWVIRRMTQNRFEAWQPKRGWLFDAKGAVRSEAHPPRRDGAGREWYGAFLPDGRWVTTDLWELDCTLSFFLRSGKWLKEIDAGQLVPKDDEPYRSSLLAWCRCDKDGRGWIVSVGSDGGRGIAWVGPNGPPRVLKDFAEPWQLAYPRDLEPKGMYVALQIPDDSGAHSIERTEPSHGSFVGFPTYEMEKLRATIPDGDDFGFWPHSQDVFIVTRTYPRTDDSDGERGPRKPIEATWFYGADGKFAGWIKAGRVADTTRLDGMLLRDEKSRVVSLGKDLRVGKVEQFRWPDHSVAQPHKLFPDLRLGFFDCGKKLILARW